MFVVVSLISRVIVFIVYWVIPEINSMHGKIVLTDVVSLAFLTSFLLIVFNIDLYTFKYLCKLLGYFGYFSFMSMFSWMTIMCFHLCSTFLQKSSAI